MRYEKGRKEASRRRIMEVAADRFRSDGIAASGLAGIMSEAGLTNGAFYPHFKSKAELVRESVAETIDAQSSRLRELLDAGGFDAVIAAYLSPRHRDDPAKGCAAAALLPELAREPIKTRRACADRLHATVREMAQALPPGRGDREDAALGIYATLIGTLQLARAAKGTPLSDRILAAGAEAARTLVEARRG
ncbi:MAG: TetR/AcrR family transcriptional regulator [Reyranella sp.]|uniref:TetR/AcrR family transcriptional regulator n=1 Tax=Reyranella sp. TaxID=1929291 RepID=UPI003D0D55BF